ncbi:MAG: hypothetical protein IJ198_06740 [Lachnospiraceae bacterium]|nr:hypothetical protein [Lachnospiraceae bacterium]
MIDREARGAGSLFGGGSAGSGDNNQNRIGISNKTIVYLVIIVLIAILCVVYGFQLRDARRGGQDPAATAVTGETAETAATTEPAAEQTPAEAPAEQAPAEKPAEEPAEAPAEAPAEKE